MARASVFDVIVFIGKPTVQPSERPIALAAGLRRLWCKVRKLIVGQWEARVAGLWGRAISGSSAIRAGLVRELRREIASCVGGLLRRHLRRFGKIL